jgi:hypothetical protein
MAWDAWSLLKDTGIGKAIAHGVGKAWDFAKKVGSSIWSDVKSILGLGESKATKPVAEKESLIHQSMETTKIATPIGKEEQPKEVRHFEKLHKEVVKETVITQRIETTKATTKEVKQNITTPIVESDSILRKVEEITKLTAPIGGLMTLAHKVGSWFSHLFGGEEEKEPPKEVTHFEKLHTEVVRETTNTQKVETVKEGTPMEVKPNITFNVSVNSTEPQKVKEEILKTLERLTPDLLDWLERALEELRHRNAPVY